MNADYHGGHGGAQRVIQGRACAPKPGPALSERQQEDVNAQAQGRRDAEEISVGCFSPAPLRPCDSAFQFFRISDLYQYALVVRRGSPDLPIRPTEGLLFDIMKAGLWQNDVGQDDEEP